jgi:uncharacterized repeat protein (TIGR02543 family)
MTKKIFGLALCLIFIFSLLPLMAAPDSAIAAGATTSITVTKYDTDGTTVLAQEVLALADLQAMTIQGDGNTHYYMQGPTFNSTSFETMWDPGETENLKDKGAVMGTDVKDLCDLVGGAVSGDDIEIKASDGYGERFHFDDVYTPEPEQGKFVVCWYTRDAGDTSPKLYPDGAYVPDFADGMQLVFMVDNTNADGKYVFGNWDMHETLPEDNWHYYFDGTTQFPSANGLSIKWISEVNIYQQPAPQWSIEVTGIVNQTVDQGWFENGLACHETATWTDGAGDNWTGLPLWYLCGLADDTNVHGIGAFNDAVAEAGYTIEVRAVDDYARTFASADVAHNNGYIVANEKNGAPLSEDDGYPLKLVGSAITSGKDRVGNIASINLLDVPVLDTWTLELSGATDYTMTQAEFEDGASCHGPYEYYVEDTGTYSGLPLWMLCGWVDDNVQHGVGAFNDALAADPGYQVKVTALDGYYFTFGSADVARNDGIIVANKLDGEDLPGGEYPLRIVGDGFSGGSGWKVREIASIELLNLPVAAYTLTVDTVGSGSVAREPDQATYDPGTPVELTAVPDDGWDFSGWSGDASGTDNPVTVTMNSNLNVTATFVEAQWSLQLNGMDQYSMGQAEFEALAAAYPLSCVVTNKDGSQDTYSGVAMWRLVGMVDDPDPASMNATYAALDYPIWMIASDGFSRSLASSQVLDNDTYIVANMMNGAPLLADKAPLRVVWEGNTSGSMVSKLVELQFTIPWDLELVGASTYVMPSTEFETAAAASPASWFDDPHTWEGLALWRLVAIVDDDDPATFNDSLAALGYDVKIIAADGYSKTITSTDIARDDTKIIANVFDGYTLPSNRWPLRFVGPGLSGSLKVSQIVRIELINTPTGSDIPVDLGEGMSINFGEVITAGITTVTPQPDPEIANFEVLGGTCYDITTTSTYSGKLLVSIPYDESSLTVPESSLRLLHYQGGVWVDVTTDVDTVNNIITGEVDSLSAFVIAYMSMKEFSITQMMVDYARQDDRDSTYLNAKFALPDGVTCDLSREDVVIDIDGFIVDIPAGSFRYLGGYVPYSFYNNLSKNLPFDTFRDKGRGSQTYVYRTFGFGSPDILVVINFKKGELNLVIRKADVDVINNYDGVTVTFSIGSVVGTETINMFIDALTYPKQR